MQVIIMEAIFSITECPKFSNRRAVIPTMFRILVATKVGLNKASDMSKSQLSNEQLELYLEMLLEKKLLAKKTDEKGREKYVLTMKGNIFITDFYYSIAEGPFCTLCDYKLNSRVKKKWLGLASKNVWHCDNCNKDYDRPIFYIIPR